MPTIRDFKVEKVLGKGTYGTVFRVCRLSDGQKYAMKQVDIKKMSPKERKATVNEVRVLAAFDSPYVLRFYECFVEEDKLHIVTDYAAYGDLLRQLKKHEERKTQFSERAVWSFFLQLCKGIQYLHQNGILHRDIKAANIFIDAEGCLKIGDFGISKVLRPGAMQAYAQIGSPYYVSPEIWKKKGYDTKSDMWAIGCFLYELIALRPPFQAKDMDGLSAKIMTGRYDPLPASTNPELLAMVRALLVLEPRGRPSIDQLFEMKSVQDHMHLVPTPKLQGGPTLLKAPNKSKHLDLQNTIGTPRRMGDLRHFLPQETRYENDVSSSGARGVRGGDKGGRADKRERTERNATRRQKEDSGGGGGCLLPSIQQPRGAEASWERQGRGQGQGQSGQTRGRGQSKGASHAHRSMSKNRR